MKANRIKVFYFLIVFIPTIIVSCGQAGTPSFISSEEVYLSFLRNNLEAQNPHALTNDEIGVNIASCPGAYFFIPSLGSDIGGRIFSCFNSTELLTLVANIVNIDNQRSWLIVKANTLVQLNGIITEQLVKQYAQAIPGTGSISIRPPFTNIITGQTNTPTYTPSLFITETVIILPSQLPTETSTLAPTFTATYHLCGSICNDGSYSESTGSGTCSHHDGVREPWYCNK
jgi:hypothetical protein